MKNLFVFALAAIVAVSALVLIGRSGRGKESRVEAPAQVQAIKQAGDEAPPEALTLCRGLLEDSIGMDFRSFRRTCEERGDDTMRKVASNTETEAAFRRAAGVLGPACKDGYELAYLGRLAQQGHEVFLWKLSPASGGNEFLVRLTLKDGRLAGFFFQ